MKQVITFAALLASFTAFSNTEELCTIPTELKTGEKVHLNSYAKNTATYKVATVVRQRSNKNYVLRNSYDEARQYETNYSFSNMYLKRGCTFNTGNKFLEFRVNDSAYIQVKNGYSYTFKKIKIVGINPKNYHVLARDKNDEISIFNKDLSEEEDRNFDHLVHVNKLYSTNICSADTDDGSRVCSGDTAISLTHGKDVKVLAIGNGQAVVNVDGLASIINIVNLINIENKSEL